MGLTECAPVLTPMSVTSSPAAKRPGPSHHPVHGGPLVPQPEIQLDARVPLPAVAGLEAQRATTRTSLGAFVDRDRNAGFTAPSLIRHLHRPKLIVSQYRLCGSKRDRRDLNFGRVLRLS